LRLNLNHLLERLGTDKLLEAPGIVLESLFCAFGDAAGKSLETLVNLRTYSGISFWNALPIFTITRAKATSLLGD
jgi:hypothetical protein